MAVQKQDDQHEHTFSSEDTWCCPEDLPRAMNNGEEGASGGVMVSKLD